ncbi:MAG: hypothetical protein ACP5QW_00145 [bacterium]
MGFEVIEVKKPSYAIWVTITIVILSLASLGISVVFAYLFITGKGNNFIYGTILSINFLITGVILVLYLKYFIGVREVSEDRKEELLW